MKSIENKDEDEKKEGQIQLTDEEKKKAEHISFFQLFRFSTNLDKALMIIGCIACLGNSATQPIFNLLWGDMTDSFDPYKGQDPKSVIFDIDKHKQAVVDSAWYNAKAFLIIGAACFILSWIQMVTWIVSGERQAIRCRIEYYRAILRQEIGWFDVNNSNELSSKISYQSSALQEAIGEKVPTFLFTILISLEGFFIAYYRGWLHSLVSTAGLPGLAFGGFVFTYFLQNMNNVSSTAYSQAGGIAEQAINSIKTVKSLSGENFELKNYSEYLIKAFKLIIKYSIYVGLSFGGIFFLMFADYALCFWYGSILIEDQVTNDYSGKVYTSGDIVTIFNSIMMGGFSIGSIFPCLKSFALGKQAAVKIFQLLDRQPKIIINNEKGIINDKLQGKIEFKNVDFIYPAKQDVKVLKNINLVISPNEKTSFVGESGSGKSTIIQLIERFYDPQAGKIIIDGTDIQEYNLSWLRKNIGYVGQEPVLFAATIKENLLFGKESATEEEMIDALKKANAWKFVSQFSKKLDTFVGVSGNQLSGGQKQRICIARAILKNPKVLLLDEATSALDRKNEKYIQQTLDQISQGRTTICIAHRLSTIMNSNKIYVLDQGAIVEEGTHNSLINNGGKYESLCKNQLQQENSPVKLQENQQISLNDQIYSCENIDENCNVNQQIKEYNFLTQQQKQEQIGKFQQITVNQQENQLNNPTQINIKQNNIQIELVEDQKYPFQLNNAIINETNQQIQEIQLEDEDKVIERDLVKELEEEKQKKQIEETQLLKQQKKLESIVMSKLYNINKPERGWFFLGLLFAGANGLTFPLIGLFMSEMMNILLFYQDSDFRYKANMFCLWFILIGCGTLIVNTLQIYFFSIVGESLTLRIRRMAFDKILKLPISFFENPKHSPGSLASTLASDAQLINQLTSSIIGINFSNLCAFICGLSIAFEANWKITLITFALSPLFVISGQLQAKFMQGFTGDANEEYKASNQIIQETVTNIRTVTSFAQETYLIQLLNNKMETPRRIIWKKGHLAGFSFGFSNLIMFVLFAIVFYIGAIYYRDDNLSQLSLFKSIFAIMYAAISAGNSNMFMGDVGKAKTSAINLFTILDQKDEQQLNDEDLNNSKQKNQLIQDDRDSKGIIEFRNVTFKYPSRDKIILQNLSFLIQQGEKIAFVGSSGCGKSTIFQLLMRFYDIQSGEILINGINIKYINLNLLRSLFGYVQQEPVLFNNSIKENIKYNFEFNNNQIKSDTEIMQKIKKAAEQANALNFIENNQFQNQQNNDEQALGFDRLVGSKGCQVSGGIAIARTILKQPQILLLDEATSALDTENEIIVQDALNQLMQGKTSLCIAHRISTIKDSSKIFVIDEGKIVEQGTYNELVEKKSYFYRLERGDN